MSVLGVKKVAAIFEAMQQLRVELVAGDKQDIHLSNVLEIGKDAMQPEFLKASILTGDKRKSAPADAVIAARLLDEILETVTEVDEETVEKNSDYFENVGTKAAAIVASVKASGSMTPGQKSALENMLAGLQKWVR